MSVRLFFIAGLIAAAPLLPQTPPLPAPAVEKPDIQTGSTEVILDLIVRDKRGRLVKDLTAEEIVVTEAGGRQFPVTSLRLSTVAPLAPQQASGSGTLPSSPPAATVAGRRADPMRQVRLVTLLFEPLPRETARLAKQIAGNTGVKWNQRLFQRPAGAGTVEDHSGVHAGYATGRPGNSGCDRGRGIQVSR